MKELRYILPVLLFVFSGCYIYSPLSEKEGPIVAEKTGVSPKSISRTSVRPTNPNESQSITPTRGDEEKLKQEEEKLKRDEERRKMEEQKEAEIKANEEAGAGKTFGRKGDVAKSSGTDRVPRNKEGQKGVDMSKSFDDMTIKELIQPNLHYKIMVDEKKYKIQADQWEGDTLISHKIRRPDKVYKFHENQIVKEEIKEREFSKPYSDLITIGSYVAGGLTVLLLLL